MLILLIMIIVLIFIESLNSMVLTKDILKMKEFKEQYINLNQNTYILINIINYFSSIFLYIVLSLFTYYIFLKSKISLSYKLVFLIFIFSNILYKIFLIPEIFKNLFYYLSIINQILIFIYILFLKKDREGRL